VSNIREVQSTHTRYNALLSLLTTHHRKQIRSAASTVSGHLLDRLLKLIESFELTSERVYQVSFKHENLPWELIVKRLRWQNYGVLPRTLILHKIFFSKCPCIFAHLKKRTGKFHGKFDHNIMIGYHWKNGFYLNFCYWNIV